MLQRIGFACKWIDRRDQVNGIKPLDDCKKLNTGTTTISWLRRQTREIAEEKLWNLMIQNTESTRLLVERVGQLDTGLRMVRLSSDLLPAYTESSWKYFWKLPEVVDRAEKQFALIGQAARSLGVRISFHPGQFTVLASCNPGIVERSIEEFEYHADMARWMGFGQRFQDMKINVHISGRRGPEGFRETVQLLSTEARNCITIENEEMSWGLEDCLSLSDIVPTVLDVHHHWIREGEYIDPRDSRVQRVIESWRGTRPTLHYSVSREDVLVAHDTEIKPDMGALLASGYKKQKLRAHSDFYWNTGVNRWALGFLDNFDIMCESKGKNLASFELHALAKSA